jgi:hypothetical protein
LKPKIENSFYFKLEFSDFSKTFFAMSSKYGNVCMMYFKDFYITHSFKSFLKDHVLY